MSFNKQKRKILSRLEFLYGPSRAREVIKDIEALCKKHPVTGVQGKRRLSQKDSLLITYGDTIRKKGEAPLVTLQAFLNCFVKDCISFLHILPFFPHTSDDGFSVADYRKVNPDLGAWKDIRRLGKNYRLVFDAVINHVSASSVYMTEQCRGNPRYEDFLITADPGADLSRVVRPRRLPLLNEFRTRKGKSWFWTTFSRDQVDLNFKNPKVLLEILDVLLFYARQGAGMIRLDAIPYLWKAPGTSCIHLPQTHILVKLIREVYDAVFPHVILLSETNVPHSENLAYFGDRGDEAQMIYNFSLPPLILFSILTENAQKLTGWAGTIQKISDAATYLNITATHDGIGLRPAEDILTDAELGHLVDTAKSHGGRVSYRENSDGTRSPYELNVSFFDAVNNPNRRIPLNVQVQRFMLSQSMPLSLLGMPGIYLHSLIGSRNDYEGVEKTGQARSINRGKLNWEKLIRELGGKHGLRSLALNRYLDLLRLRKHQSAFHPHADQEVLDFGPRLFAVKRSNRETGQAILALHNVTGKRLSVNAGRHVKAAGFADLISGEKFPGARNLPMAPYQVRWLEIH